MDTKTCKRCGVTQPVENFRPYYGDRQGRYSFCRDCERIQTRYKYLKKRGDAATPEQCEELKMIEKLYDTQRAAGLAVPGEARRSGAVLDLVLRRLDDA